MGGTYTVNICILGCVNLFFIFFFLKTFNSVDIVLKMDLVYIICHKNFQDGAESIFIDKNRCQLSDLLR